MRAAFYGVKGTGHVTPTLPLVRGLVAAGHEVFYTLTMEWRDRLTALGAAFLNTGEGESPFTTANYHGGPFPLQLVPAAEAVLPRLLEDARRIAPDVIVYDSFAPWGRAVADRLGVPAVCSVTTLVFSDDEMTPMLAGASSDAANVAASQALRDRHGVDVRPEDAGRFFAPDNLVYSVRSLSPGVASYGQRFHFVGPLGATPPSDAESARSVAELVRPGRRRIYVSMGTVLGDMMRLGPDFFRPFLDAFGGDPELDLIVSIGRGLSPDAFGPVADNVFLRSWVPQAALLEHVDVFVTHAGANSLHEALFHDVPVVCIPGFADQPLNAARAAELGAGVSLAMSGLGATEVRSAVTRVLGDPAFRTSAARIGAELRAAGGLGQALDVLARVASRGVTA
ncbi:MAG: hypothetical protein FJ104_01715 [Deltaproteobacteria bacterium]|nr:hypothetical protein [Deltaproteobacteria bacterium]